MTTMFEVKDAKRLFDDGMINGCTVAREPLGDGFIMLLHNKNGKQTLGVCSQRDQTNFRVFKNIETVIKNAEMIGFKDIQVKL